MALKKPLKNTLAAGAADAVSRILGFLATAVLARALGKDSFGMMSIALSITGYVVLFSSPGLHISGIRRIAAYEGNQRIWTNHVTSLRFFLSIVGVLLATGVSFAIGGVSGSWLVIFLFCSSAIAMALSPDWYFQGKGDLVVVSMSRIAMYCAYLLLVVVTVSGTGDLLWAGVAFCGANVVAAIWLLVVYVRRTGALELRWHPSQWLGLLRESLPLGASSFLAQSVVNLPVLVVGAMLTPGDAGLLGAAMKLVFFVLMIDRVFYTLFLPVVSKYRNSDHGLFQHVALLGMKVVLTMSVPVTVVGMAYAGDFLRVVYGTTYGEAASVLQLLLPYFLFTTLNTVMMAVMYADHRDAVFLRIMMAGTLIVLGGCIGLTAVMGVNGAALGLSVGEAAMSVMLLPRVLHLMGASSGSIIARMAIAGFIMALVLWALGPWGMALAVPVSLAVFAILVVFSGGLSRADLRFLMERFV